MHLLINTMKLSIILVMISNNYVSCTHLASSFVPHQICITNQYSYVHRFGANALLRNSLLRLFSSEILQQHEVGGSKDLFHQVQGIDCREVNIDIEKVGFVTILEATADAQNTLVDMALATEAELKQYNNQNKLQSGDPYGAVLWPAASAVANHFLTLESYMNGKDINELTLLELGAGTGLVSIAAALGGVRKIMATDYEKVPLQLLEFAAEKLNPAKGYKNNDGKISSKIDTFLFDICDKSNPLPQADIVVAADIMYEPKTGIAMAHRVMEALNNGSRVIVGCSPGR